MKYFKHTLWIAALLVLLLPGCSNEERIGSETAGNVCLTLTVPGAAEAEAETKANPDPGESAITNVYLLFYKDGAAPTAAPAFFFSATGLSNMDTWSQNFTTAQLSTLETGATYHVYALASLPATATAPAKSTSLATLLTLNEKQFERTPGAPAISFAGTSTYVGGSEQSIDIDLTRTVARIDIALTGLDAGQTAFVILDDQAFYTPFLGDGTQTNPDERTSSVASGQGTQFRGYIYENGTGNSGKATLFISILNADGSNPISYLGVINKGDIARNTIYTVNATLTTEGLITITTTALPWNNGGDITIDPGSQYPEDSAQPEANSYMVKAGSKPIYIPVSQIKKANTYNSTIPALAEGAVLTAELLWTDVKDSETGKGMGCKAPVKLIRMVGNGNEALLQVVPGTAPGNSVITVKDDKGTIRWSWHIWVIDPTVPIEEKIYTNTTGTYTLMDRHLGATSITPGNLNTYGLAYQWGRKDPFPQAGSTAVNYTIPRVVYDAAGKVLAESKGYQNSAFTIAQSVAAPWMIVSSYYSFWNVDRDKNMWGNGIVKTVYDPCPAGWRVPELNALNGMTLTNFKSTDGRYWGRTNPDLGFFPVAGRRVSDSFPAEHGGTWCFLNVSNGSDGNTFIHYRFAENYNPYLQNEHCEIALSVRCVKIVTP